MRPGCVKKIDPGARTCSQQHVGTSSGRLVQVNYVIGDGLGAMDASNEGNSCLQAVRVGYGFEVPQVLGTAASEQHFSLRYAIQMPHGRDNRETVSLTFR